MTDELSFAAPVDRQTLRREVALALLVQVFTPLILDRSFPEGASASDAIGTVIESCWSIADRFIAAGEKPQP
jgi:hypothetical protein